MEFPQLGVFFLLARGLKPTALTVLVAFQRSCKGLRSDRGRESSLV